MLCPNCAAENPDTNKFCQNCGASLTPTTPSDEPGGRATTGLEPNIAGLLCYVLGWITGLIFILIEQEDQFVRFHAWQSIFTFGGLTLIGLAVGWIPLAGVILGAIVGLATVALWILLIVMAAQGNRYKLPYIGDLAERQVGRAQP